MQLKSRKGTPPKEKYISPYKVDERWYLAPISEHCVPSTILNVRMRKRFPKVILSFSGGKDSIASYLALREAGYKATDIIPIFLYWIPKLEFEEKSLAYFEEHLFEGVHIERLPHTALYKLLNELIFQPPERCSIIEDLGLPYNDYGDLVECIIEDYKLPKDQFYAFGMRATDSLTRYSVFKNYGPVSERERKWSCVWDWRLAKVIHEIRRHGIKLPPDYVMFGRTFDGIDFRFLYPLKKYYPRDYEKVLEWFPLADLEIYRYEHRNKA